MKSKIEINISVIDDGPVVMRCQGQNTSKGKALDALEDAYLSTVAQLMRKDLSKAEQEEAAKEFGETMQDRLLAMVRGKGKRYMVSSEKEMSFMTELMRRPAPRCWALEPSALNDLHKAVTENFRQLSEWAMEDGVDVALERFCRCARDAYKTDVQVEDIPDAQALHQQQRQTRQALDGLAERAWMVEASRKRVGCLPLAPAEVEKRIQTVLQAPAMPESWERRRAR